MNLAAKSYKRAGLMIISVSLALVIMSLPVNSQGTGEDSQSNSTNDQAQRVETQAKEREARCKRRQTAIAKRTNGIYQYNVKILEHLSAVQNRVEEFVNNTDLDVDSYAGLLGAAKSSQADASTALDAIKTAPLLNCAHSDNRADLSAYKDKVVSLTDALQMYRQNLRKLIKEVKSAARPAEIVR